MTKLFKLALILCSLALLNVGKIYAESINQASQQAQAQHHVVQINVENVSPDLSHDSLKNAITRLTKNHSLSLGDEVLNPYNVNNVRLNNKKYCAPLLQDITKGNFEEVQPVAVANNYSQLIKVAEPYYHDHCNKLIAGNIGADQNLLSKSTEGTSFTSNSDFKAYFLSLDAERSTMKYILTSSDDLRFEANQQELGKYPGLKGGSFCHDCTWYMVSKIGRIANEYSKKYVSQNPRDFKDNFGDCEGVFPRLHSFSHGLNTPVWTSGTSGGILYRVDAPNVVRGVINRGNQYFLIGVKDKNSPIKPIFRGAHATHTPEGGMKSRELSGVGIDVLALEAHQTEWHQCSFVDNTVPAQEKGPK